MAPKEVYKWLDRAAEGDWLGIFIMVKGWAWSGGSPLCGPGLVWFELPTSTKGGGTQTFSSPCSDVRPEKEEDYWGLKAAAGKQQ